MSPMIDPGAEKAYAFLRSHTRGELRFDEHVRPIGYVIAPDGRLVAPVMVPMLASADTVLFVPGFAEGAMELQVTLQEFNERAEGAHADRWRIHHGDPPDVRWAFFLVDGARHDGSVLDGETLVRPNPLSAVEPALCREANEEHTADLRALCRYRAFIDIEHPVMVAIDPLGIDVRGRFDVIRVPADEPMTTADDARRILRAMREAARRAAGPASVTPPDGS